MEPRRFITAFTSSRHLSLSWAKSIQYIRRAIPLLTLWAFVACYRENLYVYLTIPPHPNFWRSILLLFYRLHLGLPTSSFPSSFPTKTLYTLLLSLMTSYQSISPGPKLSVWAFRNLICFYGKEVLEPRPTTKLEDHYLSAVRDCLFNIFAAALHIGVSSIRNQRTRHAVVTGTHLPLL
jgi:hypothetical protein